jgi:light-regulated signal transduction histidine kinase (bacteriophytochrome)
LESYIFARLYGFIYYCRFCVEATILSKNIVEAHGGRMWAENNNNSDDEKGATFYFSIPLSKEQQQPQQKLADD